MSASDIRVGDRFELTVEVTKVPVDSNAYECRCSTGPLWLDGKTLLASKRIPRAVKVNDRVRITKKLGVFRVHAIDDESAFLLPDECRPSMKASRIVPLSDLIPADGETQ